MFNIATPGIDEQDRAFLVDALTGRYGATDSLLEVMRKHPALCAVQVRVWNDQQKEMRVLLS